MAGKGAATSWLHRPAPSLPPPLRSSTAPPPPWGSIPAAARPNLTPAGDCTGALVCVDRVAPSENCPCSVDPTHTVIMLLSCFSPIPTLFVHQQSLNYAKRTCQPHPLSCRGRRTPGYGVEENGGTDSGMGLTPRRAVTASHGKREMGFPPLPHPR